MKSRTTWEAKRQGLNPQQTEFKFKNLHFSSKFDSGNLRSVKRANVWLYEIQLTRDPHSKYKLYFHFSVSNFTPNKPYTFVIKNLTYQKRIYENGLKPVFKSFPGEDPWSIIPTDLSWKNGPDGFQIQFDYTFTEAQESVSFCFSHPFSYQMINQMVNHAQEICKEREDVYFKRELLAYSLEKRKIELITLTDSTEMTDDEEPLIKGCFPRHKRSMKRPRIFNKPTIFFTARVHPGETPASHALKGVFDLLTDFDNPMSKALLKEFVFKIIPVLNPDGVYRGHFRLDTKGQNLNRYYKDPTITTQPTIFAAKAAIIQQRNLGKLKVYIDFHAHSGKKASFMYGNHLYGKSQVNNCLLAKLVSMNSLNFDFQECQFSEEMMNVVDKRDGLSRDGCGRISIWQTTGIDYCYTLECHYTALIMDKVLSPMFSSETGEIIPDKPINDINSEVYKEEDPSEYIVEILEDVGQAVLAALLDLISKNPFSRIPASKYKDLEGIREEVANFVDETWGLDEKPPRSFKKKTAKPLPRVAMLSSKKQTKTHSEKFQENVKSKTKERGRLNHIRRGYQKSLQRSNQSSFLNNNSIEENKSEIFNNYTRNLKVLPKTPSTYLSDLKRISEEAKSLLNDPKTKISTSNPPKPLQKIPEPLLQHPVSTPPQIQPPLSSQNLSLHRPKSPIKPSRAQIFCTQKFYCKFNQAHP
ncbi:unnamed protein product [Moneuplotes crassus]|uniref:Cytosolic carboxypeptidase-like protein 5 n=1 Tax=Euplotes crassus TaxID=5936 RepID=A0AAD1X0Z9_EUPCR|nr:unnamed protein product [Moneuplotes crassus]